MSTNISLGQIRTNNKRRQRYLRILTSMLASEEFTVHEIRMSCFEEPAGFITRVLKQLAVEEVLQVVDTEPSSSEGSTRYRWQQERSSFSSHDWVERQVCGKQITQSPLFERPRERLIDRGAEHLRTAELLAILIRVGRRGESALEAGERIANRLGERLDLLPGMSATELKQITSAISLPAYCELMAGIELGRRISEAVRGASHRSRRIESSSMAIEYCKQHFGRLARDRRQEEFHIVTLDTKLQPISNHQITIGTLNASLVAPREVLRPAIRDAAAAVLLVHNHPSGDPTPSREDFQVTDSLDAAAKIIGIQIIDHIIVAAESAVSIRDWRS